MKCQAENKDTDCPHDATVTVKTDYGTYHMCPTCAADYEDAGYGVVERLEAEEAATTATEE